MEIMFQKFHYGNENPVPKILENVWNFEGVLRNCGGAESESLYLLDKFPTPIQTHLKYCL